MNIRVHSALTVAVALSVLATGLAVASHFGTPQISTGGELAYIRDHPDDALERAANGDRVRATYVAYTFGQRGDGDAILDFSSRGRMADATVMNRVDLPAGALDGLSHAAVDPMERGILRSDGEGACVTILNGVNAGLSIQAKEPMEARFLTSGTHRVTQADDGTVLLQRDGHTYRLEVLGPGALSVQGVNVRAELSPGSEVRGWIDGAYPATTLVMHHAFDHLRGTCTPAGA